MALKAVVGSIDDLAEEIRGLYKAGEGNLAGKYILDVEGVDGFALENVNGLKSALGKERDRADAAEKIVKAFGDLTPEAAAEAVKRAEELSKIDPEKEADRLAEEKAAATIKQMGEKHAGELKDRDARIEKLTGTVTQMTVDDRAKAAILDAKGSVNLLLPHVKQRLRLEEGDDGAFSVKVIDPATGTQRIKDGEGNPMTMADLLSEMKADQNYARAFDGTGSSGGGTPPNGAGGSGGPKDKPAGKMTLAEKTAYISEHGNEAWAKKVAADTVAARRAG